MTSMDCSTSQIKPSTNCWFPIPITWGLPVGRHLVTLKHGCASSVIRVPTDFRVLCFRSCVKVPGQVPIFGLVLVLGRQTCPTMWHIATSRSDRVWMRWRFAVCWSWRGLLLNEFDRATGGIAGGRRHSGESWRFSKDGKCCLEGSPPWAGNIASSGKVDRQTYSFTCGIEAVVEYTWK